MYCHVTQGAYVNSTETIEPTFIYTGYTNWKDDLVKKIGFAAHKQSHCHKHVVMCIVTISATAGYVGVLINRNMQRIILFHANPS